MWTHSIFRDDIDRATEQVFEILFDRNEVKQATSGLQFYQNVQIARLSGLFPSDRAEDTQVLRSMICGDFDNLVPFDSQISVGNQSAPTSQILCNPHTTGKL